MPVRRRFIPTAFLLAFFTALVMASPVPANPLIREIRVEGTVRVDESSVRKALLLKVGDPLDEALVTRSVKELYQLGVFSRIDMDALTAEEGVVLVLRVVEFPMVRKVEITGNDRVTVQDLKNVLKVKAFSFYDPAKIDAEIEALESLYSTAGYHGTRIEADVQDSDKGVILTYRITEAEKALITEVDIVGNRALDDREVRKVMLTKEAGPLAFMSGSKGYDETKAADDAKRIQLLYMEDGYLDVSVSPPEVRTHPEGEGLYVAVTVQEGPQYVLGGVRFTGDWDGPPDFLRGEPEVAVGDVFARSKVLEDIRMYEDSYRDQGYAWCRVEPLFERDAGAGKVLLNLVLRRGPLVHIRWIHVSGNLKTRDYVIRREMRLFEGDLYSQKKLEDSRKFIRAMGFFKSVDVRPVDVGEGLADIQVRVEEGTAGSLSAGLAYSSVSGLVGSLNLSLGNFAGRGQRLNLNLESGDETSTYSVSFFEPRLFSTDYSLGVDLSDKTNEYSTYTQDSVGGSLRLGYRLGDAASVNLRYRRVAYEVYDIDPDASLFILEQEGRSTTSSMRLGYNYDTRDFPMDPTRGVSLGISGEVAGGGLGGTNDFVRFQLEASYFTPLAGDLIGLAHAELGVINSFGGSDVPVTERFFMGGLYTLRGFEYRKVGPLEDGEPIGGTKSLLVNLETTYPLVKEAGIKAVLFVDAGNVWAEGEEVSGSDIRYGAGFGFRWAAPIGLLRLEWGFNLDPRPDEEQPGWEFSIGALF